MKYIYTTILFMIFYFEAYAQNSIVGHVVDQNEQNVSYASIQIFRMDSSIIYGVSSDSSGIFYIPDLKEYKYILSCRCIGYKEWVQHLNLQNGENRYTIKLIEDNIQLQDINVTASYFHRKEDRLSIIPPETLKKHSQTGFELLYNLMIPSLSINKRTYEASTYKGSAVFYIDGRKVDILEIKTLRAKDVEKIEFIDSPTGKYAGDAAAINYITKKVDKGGYLSINGEQTIGYLNGMYDIASKLSTKKIDYQLFTGYNTTKCTDIREDVKEVFASVQREVSRSSNTIDNKNHEHLYYAQFNIRNKQEKNQLSAKLNFTYDKKPDNFQDKQIMYDKTSYTSNDTESQKAYKISANISGCFVFENKHVLDISLSPAFNKTYYFRKYEEDLFNSATNVNEDFYNLDTDISYSIPLKKQNSFSVKIQNFQKYENANYSGDYNTKQDLSSNETLFYLSYIQNINRFYFQLQPGVSSLFYNIKGLNKTTRVSPRMQTMLNYQLSNNQQILFNFSAGNSYPQMQTMNNVYQSRDSLFIQRGNPDLKMTKIYNTAIIYNLQLNNFQLQSMFIYNYFKDVIGFDYFNQNDKIIATYSSDNNFKQFIFVTFLTWKIFQNLQLKAEIAKIYAKHSGKNIASQNTFRSSFDVAYFINDFTINVHGRIPEKVLNPGPTYEKKNLEYGLNINWNHKNWNVAIGTISPLNKKYSSIQEIVTSNYSSSEEIYNRSQQQYAYIKLAYTFDFGKKTSRESNSVDRSINSAILKAR